MVENSDEAPKPKKRRGPRPEEIWIKGFLEFSGTDNICRFCHADMNGVSLTRAVEALTRGECVNSEKCDGPGTVCTFEHESEDNKVEVTVFFEAGEVKLEIRGARFVMEVDGEHNAA